MSPADCYGGTQILHTIGNKASILAITEEGFCIMKSIEKSPCSAPTKSGHETAHKS
ncbi:hypothetical protein IMPR6_390039 [Imperialibacter sp. EC-SDR9]|nr:hypothetical protein IMPERIA75_590016 [Imperialibacter sp. 75]CAD5296702.1 hypothetical protein IMPERIA89_690016 [Imperialibacter sp. 89]VVT24210.1 hypothetical protein IMPR6_390039 [Imperialibacter sp. EC-SDR9]